MENSHLKVPRSFGVWLLALLLLSFSAATAQAVSPNFVALFIHNDVDDNGNITVIEGQKVKVGWEEITDVGKLLGSKDKIQLMRAEDDSIVDSVNRGSGKSGNVNLLVKNAAGSKLYVRYVRKGTGEVINTIADADFPNEFPLLAIAGASVKDLNMRTNVLETPRRYALGDTGPAGGIVFYVTDDGLHGLEAATADVPGNPEWGCIFTEMQGADATRVGMGARNTDDILRGCLEADTAAEKTDLYSLNGYHDWFLPSQDELQLMRDNIGQGNGNPGNFSDLTYWSSSEFSDADAMVIRFGDNFVGHYNKFDAYHLVRPVRTLSGLPGHR